MRQPNSSKIPNSSPYTNGSVVNQATSQATPTTKHSMLDKLRLFNKEKSNKSQISKRTSSSSGFSSARSERSDSSVSLNEHQQATSGKNESKSTDTASSAKSSSKSSSNSSSSKLLSSKPKKEKDKNKKQTNSSSVDHYHDSNITIVDTKILPPKTTTTSSMTKSNSSSSKDIKSPASGDIKKPPLKKLDVKSESRTSLSSISSNKTQNSSVMTASGTGIPKPMAAIKGTTKAPSEVSQSPVPVGPNQVQIPQKMENNNFDKPVNGNHPETYREVNDIMHTSLTTKNVPNRKIDNFGQVIHQSNENNGNKYHTVPSKLVNATIYEEENKQQHQQQGGTGSPIPPQAVQPMRPLLRGYNSHVTLPTRGARGGQLHGHHNHPTSSSNASDSYCGDGGGSDSGSGYCSDGDALRKLTQVSSARFSSDCLENGYMSEGGTPTKHYLSVIRARSQLPTTIAEER